MKRIINREGGFTLIELLVVILIIGILIAVAAPSFLGQVGKAHDSAVKQTMALAYKSAKASSIDRAIQGNWTDAPDANSLDAGPGLPDGRPDETVNTGLANSGDPDGNPWLDPNDPGAGEFDEYDLIRQIISSEPGMNNFNLTDGNSAVATSDPEAPGGAIDSLAISGQPGLMYLAVVCVDNANVQTPCASVGAVQELRLYAYSESGKIWRVTAPANGPLSAFEDVTP